MRVVQPNENLMLRSKSKAERFPSRQGERVSMQIRIHTSTYRVSKNEFRRSDPPSIRILDDGLALWFVNRDNQAGISAGWSGKRGRDRVRGEKSKQKRLGSRSDAEAPCEPIITHLGAQKQGAMAKNMGSGNEARVWLIDTRAVTRSKSRAPARPCHFARASSAPRGVASTRLFNYED